MRKNVVYEWSKEILYLPHIISSLCLFQLLLNPFQGICIPHIYTYISRLSRWCHWKGRKKGTSGSTTMRKYADDGYRWRNIWFFYNTRQCNLGIRLLDDCYGVARVMVIATSLARWLFSAYWLLFLFLLHVFTSVCYRD